MAKCRYRSIPTIPPARSAGLRVGDGTKTTCVIRMVPGLRSGRFRHLVSPTQVWPLLPFGLGAAVDDPPSGQIIRRYFDEHSVAWKDADVILSHLARNGCEDMVFFTPHVHLHTEHCVGKGRDHMPFDLDRINLRHTCETPLLNRNSTESPSGPTRPRQEELNGNLTIYSPRDDPQGRCPSNRNPLLDRESSFSAADFSSAPRV